MLPLEHSEILLTCIKRKLVLKTIFGLHFEWPLKTGFTVHRIKGYIKFDNLLTLFGTVPVAVNIV